MPVCFSMILWWFQSSYLFENFHEEFPQFTLNYKLSCFLLQTWQFLLSYVETQFTLIVRTDFMLYGLVNVGTNQNKVHYWYIRTKDIRRRSNRKMFLHICPEFLLDCFLVKLEIFISRSTKQGRRMAMGESFCVFKIHIYLTSRSRKAQCCQERQQWAVQW